MSGGATVSAADRALVAEAVTVRRAGRLVLDGVSLRVEPGRMLGVTGASGAGKSTLLLVLAGAVAADEGAVRHGGAPVRAGDASHLRRTGYVLQGYGLVSMLTAAENVELVLQARGAPAGEIEGAAREALERAGLPDLADRLAEELSGGQQQRVAVARALVGAPELLLADEPTSELDSDNRDLVLGALREQAARGAVVVMATHDPEAAELCDGVLHLVDGRVETS